MMSERHHRRDRPSPLVFASRRRGHDRGHVCYTFSGESAAMSSDEKRPSTTMPRPRYRACLQDGLKLEDSCTKPTAKYSFTPI